MVSQVRRRFSAGGGSSPVVAYGLVVALLIAWLLVRTSLGRVLFGIDELAPALVSQRLLDTLLYSVVGVACLGGVAVLATSVRDFEADRLESIRAGLAVAIGLVVPASYLLAGAVASLSASTPFTSVVVVTCQLLLAGGFARLRGVSIPLSLPGPEQRQMVGNAVLGSVLAVAAVALGGVVLADGPLWLVDQRMFQSPLSAAALLHDHLLLSLFGALGTGVFFFGVAQESLRRALSPAGAVAVATALAGSSTAVPQWLFGYATSGAEGLPQWVLPVVGLAVVVGLPALVGGLWRLVDSDSDPALAGTVAVAAVVAAAVVLSFVAPSGLPRTVGYPVAYTAVAGIAAVTYERTRSVWVPVLAFLAFNVAMDAMTYAVSLSA